MHRWLETIYEHSPVIVQNAMISAYGWKLARLRYGGEFRKYVEKLLRSERYSASELAELQNENLRTLIRHCYENVPYYARLFQELKLTPQDFQTAADLHKLPVLDKETVREHTKHFYARNYSSVPCEIVNTSGTTGTTLAIRVDAEGRRKNYAFFGRFRLWVGVGLSPRTATFGGRTIVPIQASRPPFWRHNLAMKTLLFSSYHLSKKNMPAYLQRLQTWDPELIDTYPSSLETLASYALEHGCAGPRPRAVITSSETLRPDQRETVSRAFGTKVFDQYGSAEQVCFISECEHGSYHVHPEFGVTEFLPDASGNSLPGLSIVATGFTNWAMPLLRYRTGDLAIPSNRECVCGRKFRIVDQIVGRQDDVLVMPDGRRIGRLDPVFKGLQSVRRAQIIQENLHRIRVRIAPGKGFMPAHQESIQRELGKRLGADVKCVFEILDDIPVGAGGKFRAVISKIGKATGTADHPLETLAR